MRELVARYPIRKLDGCCRKILMLHFEFKVYKEANQKSLGRISDEVEASKLSEGHPDMGPLSTKH